jgi:nitric oxide reductase NorD protein
MKTDLHESLEPLALADPESAAAVAARLARKTAPVDRGALDRLVEEALWALGVEVSFGRAAALAYAGLAGEVPPERLETFCACLREAAGTGPTLGRIMAECLPPVLALGDGETLLRFKEAWEAMARKGTHTLREPLLALGPLLAGSDRAAAGVYLELLTTLFAADLSYEEGRIFSVALPKAARGLLPQRRQFQLKELLRVARTDRRLVEPFLTGLSRGLGLLQENALRGFVDASLLAYEHRREHGARALSLESLAAQERFSALQVSVGFSQVQDRLRRYLHARTGLALSVRPLSALAAAEAAALGPGRMVCSDAQAVYLPDEIDRFADRQENAGLYTLLARSEACFHEFGTFDFDGEKIPGPGQAAAGGHRAGAGAPPPGPSDLEVFLGGFEDPALAADLFTVFELGRIRKRLEHTYPGLARGLYPVLRRAFATVADSAAGPPEPLRVLLARLGLAMPDDGGDAGLEAIAAAFDEGISAASPVESAAELTLRFFEAVRRRTLFPPGGRQPLATPFGWRPWPNPAAAGRRLFDRLAGKIQAALAREGVAAYRSDIKRRLKAAFGNLTPEDIRELCRHRAEVVERLETALTGLAADLARPDAGPLEDGPVFRYPEWDDRLGDYLPEHVRLRERVSPVGAGGFYAEVLHRRHALVRRTRQVFERLRPEGLKRLRRWPDGDEFDYRQLIDAAVDRRIGQAPSDRLFIKRVKDRRDVAVLLLVDVSRSTANTVPGSDSTVLDIEKEAVVVLCEALTVLGDSLAVAGFSGTGRLGVDYFRIKGFEEGMSEEVKRRIGALRPQRNTRMGAAVRHAARDLDAAAARLRLLILLGDGFPNDTEYKGAHAVADTRQALMELGARGVRFHALTVNLPADPKLDRLYGKARHHVISDVRELPGKLLRVYSALTR